MGLREANSTANVANATAVAHSSALRAIKRAVANAHAVADSCALRDIKCAVANAHAVADSRALRAIKSFKLMKTNQKTPTSSLG